MSGDSRGVRPRQHDKVTVAVRSTKIKEDEDDSWNKYEPSASGSRASRGDADLYASDQAAIS